MNMDKFRNFFIGRYGNDQLNVFLFILGCIITLILSFFRIPYLSLISYIPYGIAVYRMLSKKIDKRQRENTKFMTLSAPWRKFLTEKFRQFQDKDHKYYRCPKCNHTLRVPKGKGKIKISCPHCSKEFIKRT